MDKALLKALKLFCGLSFLFLTGYWSYAFYDDVGFVAKYGMRVDYLVLWLLYAIAYFAAFSFYYWLTAFAIILVYYKIILRFKQHK